MILAAQVGIFQAGGDFIQFNIAFGDQDQFRFRAGAGETWVFELGSVSFGSTLDGYLTLRDASAYNIQFINGRPILIDTLSFEEHTAGEPWVAYRQFCQHFLAPLVLMSRVDLQLSQLLRIHIDGIPLPLAAKLSTKAEIAWAFGAVARITRAPPSFCNSVTTSCALASM